MCVQKLQITKSFKHTTCDYIPNMKYLKPNSYLNWFEANSHT